MLKSNVWQNYKKLKNEERRMKIYFYLCCPNDFKIETQ